MIDIVKKSMLAGIGLASITKEKIEEVAGDLMKQGRLTEQEGRKFVEEMLGYAEKTKGDIEKYIDKSIEKTIAKLDLVRKSDLDDLKASIEELKSSRESGDRTAEEES